ncbi:hexosaminidase [Flaviramulus basaltis]|uniref:Hexosaminidase n=1 Tax=Flaviramulus basaltis TaxID=369401 RepID=A0A1K2IF88_9FLAO|nr:family 20 glycosylhydrolase [Flaviramulus basaltis]SFZ90371.1 hexosaminidase [Flaviramulus basaltis]
MKKNIFILMLCNVLWLSCNSQTNINEKYNLMPWPNDIIENTSKFIINSGITISINGEDEGRVYKAAVNFLRRLSNRSGVFIDKGFPITNEKGNIIISFETVSSLSINDDESYALNINNNTITIKAKTDVGALRGLETLLQLTANDDAKYYFPGVTINDSPRFVWRGLMIDVSRHFQPIDVLKRNLRAMASVKMNVFHWHLTDDQGFRVESKVYPKLHQLASDGLYYTQIQIKEIVNYASDLGIRVVPEFDVPGHASAFLTAYPELSSKEDYNYTIERYSGVFDPTLNPTKEITYKFLDNLFTEMASLFPDAYFHIGGDENEGKHWDENKDIQAFMTANNLKTNHELQTYFNIRLEKILKKLNKNLMGWDEIMTPNMPKSAVIHAWRGENEGLIKGGSLISAAKAGYKTVLSNGFYIDRMQSLEYHYSVEPIGNIKLTEKEHANILGGEATMWSELVTPLTIDSRIWPRTAAIAERFWSKKEVNNLENMKLRLNDVSYKLEELGITHIRNRDVILRSITNNQDISTLIDLSKICEPLKIYERNKNGVEYKTFSPFSLFADACVADAEDAVIFNKEVKAYLENSNNESLEVVKKSLKKWSNIHNSFQEIKINSKIKDLESFSENISIASEILLMGLETKKKISLNNQTNLTLAINVLKEPCMDVELAIIESLEKLSQFLLQV